MENQRHAKKITTTPEWVTAGRRDRIVVPEVSGGWRSEASPLSRGRSFTDWKNKVMASPAGETLVACGVRNHELIHALVSPASVPLDLFDHLGLSPTAVEVAEELRVNAIGLKSMDTRVGVRQPIRESIFAMTDGTEEGGADFAVNHNDWENAVALLTATFGTQVYKDVKRRLRKKEDWKVNVAGVDDVLKRLHKDLRLPTRTSTEAVRCSWTDSKGRVSTAILPLGWIDGTLPLAQAVQQMMKTPPQPEDKNKTPKEIFTGLQKSQGKVNWQIMKLGMSRLTQPSANFIGRKKFASTTGKTIKHPERMFTDPERRLFSRSLKGTGGVVVVDCSGSMGLNDDELTRILKASPGCTVIGYSTGSRTQHNAFVLAKGGRRVAENELTKILSGFGGGNGIDLPALVWGNNQRKNKKEFLLWISDGWVTGESDTHTEGLALECIEFLQKNGGANTQFVEAGITLLESLAKGKAFPKHLLCYYLQEIKAKTENERLEK